MIQFILIMEFSLIQAHFAFLEAAGRPVTGKNVPNRLNMAIQADLKTIHVNGTELHYIEQGQGEPLVLVHGSLSDYRMWLLQIEAFSPHYRVIAYSRRYHYPNAWPDGGSDYSMDLHAADLAALLQALGLEQVRLVGHSFGAATSLIMALHHPQLVSRLVLGEPPFLNWLETLPDGQSLVATFLADAAEPSYHAFEHGDQEGGIRYFIDGVSGRGAFERVPPTGRAIQMENARSLQAEMDMIARFGTRRGYFASLSCANLNMLNVPTLLVGGDRSPVMFHLVLDELARCLPQARQVTIPSASHSMIAGNPLAFNGAVMEFLGN